MAPYGNKKMVYGPTGPVPGGKMAFTVPTTVIKGDDPDYCYRDEVKKETICYRPGIGIYRDKKGYYHYGVVNNTARKSKTRHLTNTGVVAK